MFSGIEARRYFNKTNPKLQTLNNLDISGMLSMLEFAENDLFEFLVVTGKLFSPDMKQNF